jgi:putative endonuclease
MTQQTGAIGEQWVAHWLAQQQWTILRQRWRSRWGEIDLIAESPQREIVFIEVKTRSRGNWDENGMLSVNLTKQAKIQKTAASFLQRYPQFCDRNCRFDVALVSIAFLGEMLTEPETLPKIELSKPALWQGYRLTLFAYLENAFTG